MTVAVREVRSRKDLKRFIYLPKKIHAGHINWVPPIYKDEWDFYNPVKNKSFQHCSSVLFLAFRNGALVGRTMGIINHAYNALHQIAQASMFAFECMNDHEVARAITKKVEAWARDQGMTRIIGPFGFSDKDPQGFMIEGFDEPMVIATNCSLPYMPELMDQCGYSKEVDLHEYKVIIPKEMPGIYASINERLKRNNGVSVKEFDTRRELKPFIKPVFELINETFGEIYGFLQLDAGEIAYFVNRYIQVINPRFVKVILDANKDVVAFVIAMPELSDGIRKARGRLLPFGIFKILRAARKTTRLTMLLGAIRKDYRNRGLDAVLGMKMLQTAISDKYELISSHLVLETNRKMLAEYERLGGQVCKRYRIYHKEF